MKGKTKAYRSVKRTLVCRGRIIQSAFIWICGSDVWNWRKISWYCYKSKIAVFALWIIRFNMTETLSMKSKKCGSVLNQMGRLSQLSFVDFFQVDFTANSLEWIWFRVAVLVFAIKRWLNYMRKCEPKRKEHHRTKLYISIVQCGCSWCLLCECGRAPTSMNMNSNNK